MYKVITVVGLVVTVLATGCSEMDLTKELDYATMQEGETPVEVIEVELLKETVVELVKEQVVELVKVEVVEVVKEQVLEVVEEVKVEVEELIEKEVDTLVEEVLL